MTLDRSESTLGSSAPLAEEIAPDIEATILRLVVDGFQRWRDGGFRRYGEYEDDYTVRLVACMKEIERKQGSGISPQFQDVRPSDAMFAGLEDPAQAPHIDVTFSWDLLADEAYFS